jgi:hypothetical protein
VTSVMTRTGSGLGATTVVPPGRSIPRRLPLLAAALVVLGMAAWSVVTMTKPAAPAPGLIDVDGGRVIVGQVQSAAAARHAMPGMGANNDPVPDGMRRVSVDVTLTADVDETMSYASGDFTLEAPGKAPVPPHNDVLPGEELPAGTSIAGTLIFDVPQDAISAVLAFDGGTGTEVSLPPEVAGDAPVPHDQQKPHGMPADLGVDSSSDDGQ